MQQDGSPAVTQRIMIAPPHSKIGTIDDAKIKALVEESPLLYKYKDPIDRESAYEILTRQFTEQTEAAARQAEEKQLARENAAKAKEEAALMRAENAKARAEAAKLRLEETAKRKNQSTADRLGRILVDSITRSVGREITRGVFGSIKKMLR